MGFDVKTGFLCESLSFEKYCFKESYFVLWYFGRELYCGIEFVSFFNKSCWNFWNFMLYKIKCMISLLLIREHGINYFYYYKLIIMIIIIYYFRLSTYHSRLSILAETRRRKNLHFSVIFRPRVMVRLLEVTHDLSLCSRRSTDWANYVAVKDKSEVMTKVQRVYSYSWTFWGLIL